MEALPGFWGDAFRRLFGLRPLQKRFIQVVYDTGVAAVSFAAAYVLSDLWHALPTAVFWQSFVLIAVMAPVIAGLVGAYNVAIRYIRSFFAIRLLLVSLLLGCLVFFLLAASQGITAWRLSFDVFTFSLILMAAPRVTLRWAMEHAANARRVPALIYGAGSAGRQLAGALESSTEYRPVAFLEDDALATGRAIRGLPVFEPGAIERLIAEYKIEVVLLAIPSAGYRRRKAVLKYLEPYPVRVQTVPGIIDLITGKAKVNELQDVAIEDLLGREAAEPISDLIGQDTTYKSVMVTGAGGSIGSELARRGLDEAPHTLVLFERSEYALYSIDAELQERQRTLPDGSQTTIIPVLGSVQNIGSLEAVMRRYAVDTVVIPPEISRSFE